MKLVALTAAKGGPVWINPGHLLYVSASDPNPGGASMYGDNNVSSSSRLCFAQGATLEVKEPVGEIVARLTE